jgi:adenosyl cobinamide kinase/adenosyl cobinamide phosphate guanylyltransferase
LLSANSAGLPQWLFYKEKKMILIFGGAYQGKLAYALERFNLAENDVYKCNTDDVNTPVNKKIIYETEKWILALVKNNLDVGKPVQQFINDNNDTIVICNDISCGVVPVDPVLRKWREVAGRFMSALSQKSDEVIRLFCGIATRVK